MICPNCKKDINDGLVVCDSCGFDIELYVKKFNAIYEQKLQKLNELEQQPTIIVSPSANSPQAQKHKPRCPFCNSENLTRITSFDRAVKAAIFGLLGNKRKYQWHCNNCKTNW